MTTPPIVPPTVPTSGELAIKSSNDVLRFVPAKYKRPAQHPVLDALLEALTEIAIAWQDVGSKAADQSDVATATDQYLNGLADDRGFHRAIAEDNNPFRDRVEEVPRAVDAVSIRAAADAILAPFTAVKTKLFDSILDRLFITDGTASFHSFIADSPQYPDRLYPDDAALNGGAVRAQSDPGAARAFTDRSGRFFVLRVPDISQIDSDHMFVLDTSDPSPGVIDPSIRSFIGDETQSDPASYAAYGTATALQIFQRVADAVQAIVGHGFRWELTVDPTLT